MWLTNKETGGVFNTDWADKERQIAENKRQADERNSKKDDDKFKFKEGDTPKTLDKKGRYKVQKIALDDSKDSDYGEMSGEDAAGVLKGFRYEEPIPGDGMWYKNGASYAFDVKRVK